ncbi:MAG: hypothetical protein AB7U87_03415 [Candidatus Bipolaricaulis sp.]
MTCSSSAPRATCAGAVQAALNRRPAEPADCRTAIEPAIAVARLGPGDLSALTVRFHVQRTVEHVPCPASPARMWWARCTTSRRALWSSLTSPPRLT